MAQFIKIGNRFLNLDRITDVIDMGTALNVFFGEDSAPIKGEPAAALRAYLQDQTTDVLAWYEKRQAALPIF